MHTKNKFYWKEDSVVNLKKAASAAIAAVMALSMSSSPAFAATAGPNILPVDGKKTQLRATVDSTYTLTVPEAIILNKVSQAKTGSGLYANTEDCVVSLKGDIGKDQTLTVTTSTPVLKCAGSPDETATIDTSAKSVFTRDDLFAGAVRGDDGKYSEPTGTSIVYPVSAKLTPGNWVGTVVFGCNLEGGTDDPGYRDDVIPNGAIYASNGVEIEGDGEAVFPEQPQNGDAYVEGDYVYDYEGDIMGWGVISTPTMKFIAQNNVNVADALKNLGNDQKIYNYIMQAEEKTTYDRPLTSICNIDVAAMSETYAGLTKLKKAPKIPISVIDMEGTFADCTALEEPPAIPAGVTEMSFIFNGCTSLVTAPTIPGSVRYMYASFDGCTSLVKAPAIPESVMFMENAFNGCISLTGTLICDANPTEYANALMGTQIATIEGSCSEETKAALLATR